MYRRANDLRNNARAKCAVVTKNLWLLLSATPHENSTHLSTAAVLFSKVTAASSLLIGEGSCCLSLVVVCVVYVSHSPSSCFAFGVVMICDFFSCSSFSRDVRISDERLTTDRQSPHFFLPDTSSFFIPSQVCPSSSGVPIQLQCAHPTQVSTCSSHKRGSLFKVCYQFCGSLIGQWPGRCYPSNSSQAWRSSQRPRKTPLS